jgi:RHS repeat-associated protein
LTSRGVPGAVDVLGLANRDATVTVNSQATWRRGEYFHRELAVNNTNAAQYTLITVQASQGGTNTAKAGYVYLPQTPEAFSHDLDGNVTSDGRWNYTWDAENRLIRLVARTGVGPQQRLDFAYDAQGRRIGKKVWPNTGGTGTPLLDRRFLYDGWNLVAELNATNNAVIRSYVWGLDLSGSEQGAGGVGGLLLVKPAGANALFPAYDGNGNVMGLVDGTTGTVTAQYEYGPFGEPIRVSGAAASNPFRFSTKYQDDETDLVYYGYRYYVPSTGRWLSRDPLSNSRTDELRKTRLKNPRQGFPPYRAMENNAIVIHDYLGLMSMAEYLISWLCPLSYEDWDRTWEVCHNISHGGKPSQIYSVVCGYAACTPDEIMESRNFKRYSGPRVQIGQWWDEDVGCMGLFSQPIVTVAVRCWGCNATCWQRIRKFSVSVNPAPNARVNMQLIADATEAVGASRVERGCSEVPNSEESGEDESPDWLDLTEPECFTWGRTL